MKRRRREVEASPDAGERSTWFTLMPKTAMSTSSFPKEVGE
jgi:hypothetical protein